MKRPHSVKKVKAILILVLFMALLTGGRMLWLAWFKPADQPHAANGILDLRDWNIGSGQPIALDGEWEFYPEAVLAFGGEAERLDSGNEAQYVQVPGNWNAHLDPDAPVPFGYGAYRLRIMVPPGDQQTYSIHVASVRSASRVFVNGRLLGSSGNPAPQEEGYTAGNVPYTVWFAPDENGMIEVVLQAANFSDPRGGGLIRSLKFGKADAVNRELQLSFMMQQLIAAALLFQAIHLLLIFFIDRNKKWFYLSLVLLNIALLLLVSSDDKQLLVWLPIDYDWSFKLLNLSLSFLIYALMRSVEDQFSPAWRSRIIGAAGLLCGIAVGLALLLPAPYQIALRNGLLWSALPLTSSAFFSIFRVAFKGLTDNLLAALACSAFIHHFMWSGFYLLSGIKTVAYPFDILAGLVMFSSIMFKRYFELYAEQKRLTAKLRDEDRKKDDFLANTSHEMRNPLHGILNISQVVLERERLAMSARSVKELETVLAIGRRMSLMLDDLLDSKQLKDGRMRLHPKRVSLQSVAGGVMDLIRFMAEGKPIKLTNRIAAGFPDVIADENRLAQILFNLLHNAVKFTDAGEVSIEAEVRKGKARIAVSDTGVGMDENVISRVFDPNEQGALPVEGGLGLGLSISKQLVELHGGEISAQSVPGEGSQFVFTLPLAEGAGEASPLEETAQRSGGTGAEPCVAAGRESGEGDGSPHFAQDRPRILAVDDDAVNLQILKSVLSMEGYDIVTVTSSPEALHLIKTRNWDLVITDIMMPEMSGFELTRKIREHHAISELPVLLLTARNRTEDIEYGFHAGANDFVSKPVDARELKARVEALSQLKKSARERLRLEVAWLQAQIEPHFFFNTLNAIAALHVADPDRMLELLDHFSKFLREKFKFQSSDELILVEEEFSLIRSYLFIEKVRFGDRLKVHWELDDPEGLKVPPYTIQPLVENAIKHGILEREEGGSIWIRLSVREHDAEVSVTDNGVGMEEETIRMLLNGETDSRYGIGLRNVNQRLQRIYGEGLKITSKAGEGTKISFMIHRPSLQH